MLLSPHHHHHTLPKEPVQEKQKVGLFLYLFVLLSLVLFLNNLLLPQPAHLQYSVGHFDTFSCQPSSLHQHPKPILACIENYRYNQMSTTTVCNVKDTLRIYQDSFQTGTSPAMALLLQFLVSQSPTAHQASQRQAGQPPDGILSHCARLKTLIAKIRCKRTKEMVSIVPNFQG